DGMRRRPDYLPSEQDGMRRRPDYLPSEQDGMRRRPDYLPSEQDGMRRRPDYLPSEQDGMLRRPDYLPSEQDARSQRGRIPSRTVRAPGARSSCGASSRNFSRSAIAPSMSPVCRFSMPRVSQGVGSFGSIWMARPRCAMAA